MKLNAKFTLELNDPTSPEFKKLAKRIEDNLQKILKEKYPDIVMVKVFSFKPGSVLAEFQIFVDGEATVGKMIDASVLSSAISSAIKNGLLEELQVDKSFDIKAKSMFIFMNTCTEDNFDLILIVIHRNC